MRRAINPPTKPDRKITSQEVSAAETTGSPKAFNSSMTGSHRAGLSVSTPAPTPNRVSNPVRGKSSASACNWLAPNENAIRSGGRHMASLHAINSTSPASAKPAASVTLIFCVNDTASAYHRSSI
ncbi:hypothetical protein Barb7_02661 [Bacteroidales bacterium Barb7]|nr:hypothetical protein Barb7_02661 [Bacteroidales bacterium Barb7]